MNPWHDITSSYDGVSLTAVIEISRGSHVKYEMDKETGLLCVDRVLHSAVYWPFNYGFLPQTLAPDDDPLDVLIMSNEPFNPMSLVRNVRPIGLLRMIDQGKQDDKVLAVHGGDPTYASYTSVAQLPSHVLRMIERFFQDYKILEGKEVAVDPIQGPEIAHEVIAQALGRYVALFVAR